MGTGLAVGVRVRVPDRAKIGARKASMVLSCNTRKEIEEGSAEERCICAGG